MNIKALKENPLFIKYKFFIIPVLSILISILLLVFLIVPQITSGLDTQKQVEQVQTQVDKLTQKNDQLEKIDDSAYNDNVKTTLVAIPQEKDVSGAIGQVLFFVRNNQLTLSNVGFGASSADENGIQNFQIRLDFDGDLADLKQFITDIKKAPRILKISGIEISGNKVTTKTQSSLSILAYFEPLPTAIGKIDQPLAVPTPKDLELLAILKNNLTTVPVTNSEDATGPHGKTDPFQ